MSIMVGTGRGARSGVLVKKAEALETLEKVNVVVVDKTGTLTEGKPAVQRFVVTKGYDENAVISSAAGLEQASTHPLSGAIMDEAKRRNIYVTRLPNVESIAGKGLRAWWGGAYVMVGAYDLCPLKDTSANEEWETFNIGEQLKSQNFTLVYVFSDSSLIGILAIADAVKPSAKEAVHQLHQQNIQVVMMTGDNQTTGQAVANELGIDQVFAEVMPDDKAAKVIELQSQAKIVAMAGDGVNDAPALAQADVGIAFATGTDVAIESADITLLKPDLDGILKAINLSRATMQNIRQNLFFAFIYNLVGVPIAAGVLFPFIGLLLSPMIASAAMTFSSVSVILNALRLRKLKL
jgi:Cu+-exporting ATPase